MRATKSKCTECKHMVTTTHGMRSDRYKIFRCPKYSTKQYPAEAYTPQALWGIVFSRLGDECSQYEKK